ncbi:MAG: 1,4-alpha-glucan branching protein domain-containing protein [Fidelibacterota bacterium]
MEGYFTFVFHSHLPYVINHGEWPHGMDWLYEAAAETYIPLLKELDSLAADGISPKVTLGITPILAEQLAADKFKAGLIHYLDQKIEAARDNQLEFVKLGNEHLERLAQFWLNFYTDIKQRFSDVYHQDLLAGFRKLQEDEQIEIITCAATHGYFPLLGSDEAIDAQIRIGKETYQRHFGCAPRGMWLPECAYRPSYEWSSPIPEYPKIFQRKGIEEFLYKYDIQYFIVDKHLIMGGEGKGVYIDRFDSLKQLWRQFEKNWKPRKETTERSIYENYLVSSTGTSRAAVVYGRHEESSLQVWSGEYGYPGDGRYLDFHKKHYPGGHRFWKVTSAKADLADKQEYYPEDVEEALENQASHFAGLVHDYLHQHYAATGRTGILTAPFDTELFGHWWFEGTRWVGKVLRKLNGDTSVRKVTLGEHLRDNPPKISVSLPEGSWGQGGFHYIWLNEWTQWTWKHIYAAEDRMIALADQYKDTNDATLAEILNIIARQLLLLESSDWQFLISTWSARDYAEDRVTVHDERIKNLRRILDTYLADGSLSDGAREYLDRIQKDDEIFPTLDFRYWCTLGK